MTNGVEIPFGKQWKYVSVACVCIRLTARSLVLVCVSVAGPALSLVSRLTVKKREIEYFLDGEALGVAFGGIAIPGALHICVLCCLLCLIIVFVRLCAVISQGHVPRGVCGR